MNTATSTASINKSSSNEHINTSKKAKKKISNSTQSLGESVNNSSHKQPVMTNHESITQSKKSNYTKEKTATFLTEELLNLSLDKTTAQPLVAERRAAKRPSNNNKQPQQNSQEHTQGKKQPKKSQDNKKTDAKSKTPKNGNVNSSAGSVGKNVNTNTNANGNKTAKKTSNSTSTTNLSNNNNNCSNKIAITSPSTASTSPNSDHKTVNTNMDNNSNSNKNQDIRARYWTYLFDNLKRAVDEIYQTCENDDNISECKEAILILENCTNDFRSLINRIHLMKEYERSNKINKRPNPVAWEVRKSSPTKSVGTSTLKACDLSTLSLLERGAQSNSVNSNNSKVERLNRTLVESSSSSAMTGFKDFLPSNLINSMNVNNFKSNVNSEHYYADEDDEDYGYVYKKPSAHDRDDDDDDEDYDLDELDYENDPKYNDPIDVYNHETFSDLQSINTEDMSFNALSLTPPLPSANETQSNTKQKLTNEQAVPFFQPFHNQYDQPVAWLTASNGGIIGHPNLLFHHQQQPFTSVPPPSLNDSIASHFLNNNNNKANERLTLNPNNYSNTLAATTTFPNPSELSPFNMQKFTSQTTTTTISNASYANNPDSIGLANYQLSNASNENNVNSLKNGSNFMFANHQESLADRFDSDQSNHAYSTNASLMANSYNQANYPLTNVNSSNTGRIPVRANSNKDVWSTMDDDLEFEYLNNKNQTDLLNQSLDNNLDNHHHNMIRFYEEEEKNIEFEIKQDEKLLIVLAHEAKLTRQLSVEQLKHYTHYNSQYQMEKKKVKTSPLKKNNFDDNSKNSTDMDTTETERNTPINLYKKVNYHNDWNNDDLDTDMVRTPGRGLQMHEKLLSMSRKPSPNERKRKHEEKQARAQEKRDQFYQDRLEKLRELTKKIKAVNELREKLLRTRKATLKAKLQRAEEKRKYLLGLKASKAADEEMKAHEIAFINSLEAQNRKHYILEKYEKRNEAIKQNLEEERLRKQEEQKAKEHAAELRRKELESQRLARLEELLEKRRLKESKIEQNQLEKEKERLETARAKEKTREMRLAIMEAQFQANKQQVKKRILQKQEEWSKRHEFNLEEIRKKAFEMSVLRFSSEDHHGEAPTPVPYDKPKYCNACSVVIGSELQLKSHLRGLKHQQTMNETSQGKNLTKSEIEEYNLNCIVDLPKDSNHERDSLANEERKKLAKKRIKKLKNKITAKCAELESLLKQRCETPNSSANNNNNNKSKLPKLIKELEKILHANDRFNANLDRYCGDLSRALQKNAQEQTLFLNSNGVTICVKLLELLNQPQQQSESNPTLIRSTINLINVLINATKNNPRSCLEFLFSNKLVTLIEILNAHSSVMLNDINFDSSGSNNPNNNNNNSNNNKNAQQKINNKWLVCSGLYQLISIIFSYESENNNNNNNQNKKTDLTNNQDQNFNNAFLQQTHDYIGLMASYELIDTLSVFFSNIRGPLDDEQQQQTAEILKNCLNFLISITKFLSQKRTLGLFTERKIEDTTKLISTLKATNLVNIISMLYGMLHKDASTPVKSMHSSSGHLNSQQTVIKKQTDITLELTNLSVKSLNNMFLLDLNMVQELLGEESLSLQLRHITSYLLWYLSANKNEDLLHEIILLVGYFTVLNNNNQLKLELGTPPTILQQLCNLSFNYFSDKKLISILYPTLICCCYNNEKNKSVLDNELNANMLVNFIQENENENDLKSASSNSDKFELSRRFPSKLWSSAVKYFS